MSNGILSNAQTVISIAGADPGAPNTSIVSPSTSTTPVDSFTQFQASTDLTSQKSSNKSIHKIIAKSSFHGTGVAMARRQLSFKEDTVINLDDNEGANANSKWFLRRIADRCNPRSGYFPRSYVQPITPDHTLTTTVLSPQNSTAPTDSLFQASMNSTLSISTKGTEAEVVLSSANAKVPIELNLVQM